MSKKPSGKHPTVSILLPAGINGCPREQWVEVHKAQKLLRAHHMQASQDYGTCPRCGAAIADVPVTDKRGQDWRLCPECRWGYRTYTEQLRIGDN